MRATRASTAAKRSTSADAAPPVVSAPKRAARAAASRSPSPSPADAAAPAPPATVTAVAVAKTTRAGKQVTATSTAVVEVPAAPTAKRGRKPAAAAAAAAVADAAATASKTAAAAAVTAVTTTADALENKPAAAAKKAAAAPKKALAKGERMNATMTTEPILPITADDASRLKVVTWNVNGIRAVLDKGSFTHYIEAEQPDVLFLNETKVADDSLPTITLPGYTQYWACSSGKKGYAGTAMFTKIKPVSVLLKSPPGFGHVSDDDEGRVIIAEFPRFFAISTYTPNSGQALERLGYRQEWDKHWLRLLEHYEAIKPVVWLGDLNVAHTELDLSNPKGNKKTSGFTPEERAGFSSFLAAGWQDVYRKHNAEATGEWTYWSFRHDCRSKNIGWRLDYAVTKALLPQVEKIFTRQQVMGSDHCPLGVLLPRSLVE